MGIRNRTETGRFGPVSVRFRVFFFSVWLFFMGKNRTKPKMITPIVDQYTWIEKRTNLISYKWPAYVRDVEVHNLILERICSTKAMQSLCFSRVVIKGTPKYLIGEEPNLKHKRSKIDAFKSSSIPDIKTWIFSRLITSLNNTTKSSRTLLTKPIESMFAWQNIIRSSSKHKE